MQTRPISRPYPLASFVHLDDFIPSQHLAVDALLAHTRHQQELAHRKNNLAYTRRQFFDEAQRVYQGQALCTSKREDGRSGSGRRRLAEVKERVRVADKAQVLQARRALAGLVPLATLNVDGPAVHCEVSCNDADQQTHPVEAPHVEPPSFPKSAVDEVYADVDSVSCVEEESPLAPDRSSDRLSPSVNPVTPTPRSPRSLVFLHPDVPTRVSSDIPLQYETSIRSPPVTPAEYPMSVDRTDLLTPPTSFRPHGRHPRRTFCRISRRPPLLSRLSNVRPLPAVLSSPGL